MPVTGCLIPGAPEKGQDKKGLSETPKRSHGIQSNPLQGKANYCKERTLRSPDVSPTGWPQSLQREQLSERSIQIKVISETPVTVSFSVWNCRASHAAPDQAGNERKDYLLSKETTDNQLGPSLILSPEIPQEGPDPRPLASKRLQANTKLHKFHKQDRSDPAEEGPLVDHGDLGRCWGTSTRCKLFEEKTERTMGARGRRWPCIMSVCTHIATLSFYFKLNFWTSPIDGCI